MAPDSNASSKNIRNKTLRSIARQERREILNSILKRGPVSQNSLADDLAGIPSPTRAHVHSARAKLVHSHLPLLTAAGLTTWDRASGTVDTTDHPALTDKRFLYLLQLGSEGVDDVLDALSHEYRRIILTTLWEGETEQNTSVLADKIAQVHDHADVPSPGSTDEITITLHHAHLPRLDEYDLVELDSDVSRVRYTGHPALEEVFALMYEPHDHFVAQFDGLLSGLSESFRSANAENDRPVGWPHHWSHHHD